MGNCDWLKTQVSSYMISCNSVYVIEQNREGDLSLRIVQKSGVVHSWVTKLLEGMQLHQSAILHNEYFYS